MPSYGGFGHLDRDHGLDPICQAVRCLLHGSLGGASVRPEYLYQFLGPSVFCLAQTLFQLIEYDLVGDLSLPIGLRMLYRGRDRFDAQVVIKGLQALVNKLSAIISYYRVRDAKSTNNAPPYKILHIFGRDGGKGFGLDPLSEVVDSHQEEFGLPFSWRKGTGNVHSPDGERPWGDNVVQLFRPCVMERVELLTLGTFLHVFDTVTLEGRPVVSGSQDLSDHRPRLE